MLTGTMLTGTGQAGTMLTGTMLTGTMLTGTGQAEPRAPGARAAAAAALSLPERLVECVGDGAPGSGQAAQQRVGVGQLEHPRHFVLLLQHQPVGPAAGHLMQRVPGIED